MTDTLVRFAYGPQMCGALPEAATREWLLTDGLGGFAMGTAAGLRTRRYHGLLAVPRAGGGRDLALAALDPVLDPGGAHLRLATHEWAGGALDPRGHELLASFAVEDGLPVWRWAAGELVLERRIALAHGRPLVAVVHRLLRAPGPVRLELSALCTWRDVHGERHAYGMPGLETAADGFVFEGAYQVRGPGFEPAGEWFQGVFHREEAARGLAPSEDLFHAGTFGAELAPGQELAVVCWAGGGDAPPAAQVLEDARTRARAVVTAAGASDDVERALALAADQFVVDGPDVMAGYPWFERWARDTMTSYEGLFLETGRLDEGRALLLRAGGELSDGLLLNNTGGEHNTVDGSLWFVHAAGRHVERTGDDDLAAALVPALDDVIAHYAAGTDFGIRADNDGLLRAGADGYALTWMDARVDGRPITSRAGKPVEINALWVDALTTVAALRERLGREPGDVATLADRARTAFAGRFVRGGGLLDVAGPDDPAVRPNQLLAASLPHAPLADPVAVHACAPLLTTLGLRSLAPSDPAYRGRHRGDGASRDAAYHQGTVWPWLVGPYVEAALKTGVPVDGVLDGLVAHLADFGIGSVSETADGDAPHAATGCPFQAWSVAELLRARRLVLSSG